MSGDGGVSAFPEEDNIFCWKGTISGSNDTVKKLNTSYPSPSPPTALSSLPRLNLRRLASIQTSRSMETYAWTYYKISGHMLMMCLDILQDKWSSAYDVRTILLSIQSLLGEPNTSSPLNTQAASLWGNQEEYRKMVEKLYKPTA